VKQPPRHQRQQPPPQQQPRQQAPDQRRQPPQQPPGQKHHGPPTYRECPSCGFLSDDARFGRGEIPCPACGNTDKPGRLFPPDRLRRLDGRIRTYHAEGEYEVVVILGATFLESLMEDILARILNAHGADKRVQALVLDTLRSVGQRVGRLFPALTGTPFEDAATKAGFREFPRRWREVRGARNAFIHDSAFNGEQESIDSKMAEQTMELLGQAYRLFVAINNEFVARPNHAKSGRSAT